MSYHDNVANDKLVSMLIILDFDGVLFQRRKFKIKYQKIFNAHGISKNVYTRTYNAAKQLKYTYSIDAHLKIVRKQYPALAHDRIRRDLWALAGQGHQFIFRDARPFLSFFKKQKAVLALLSSGFPSFQKEKIRTSRIQKFFDRVIVIPSLKKTTALVTLMKHGPSAFFIDDTAEIIDAVQKRFPSVYTIQLRRDEMEKKSVRVDAVVRSLMGARREIIARTKKRGRRM